MGCPGETYMDTIPQILPIERYVRNCIYWRFW